MRLLRIARAIVGAVPRAAVRRHARAFRRASTDCRRSQEHTLRRLLALNADSEYSRRTGLDRARSVAEFRTAQPIADYEHYRPWIERVKTGDHGALLGADNRLLMFALSSGTTAEAKFIPITRRFLDDYRRGWQVWGIRTLDDHPGVNTRNIVQLSSDYDQFRTAAGTPCGNISGLVAAMQKRIVRTMYTVPGYVGKIANSDARYYTTLRLALADAHIGMIVTANPSTLIHLAQLAEQNAERLIRDVADGTLSVEMDSTVRTRLSRRVGRRRPRRARELEALASTGRFTPRFIWPGLQVVGVWTGGSAGAYLPALRRHYGDVAVRDHGLSASEGRMTIPLDGSSGGVLDVDSHFFEFIPEDEIASPQPTVLAAHELAADRNYYILLTTSSGLYRYNISDVVRCTGFFRTTPLLEFLHKGARIANLTGEKISESQVVQAVTQTLQECRIQVRHFTVSPVWGEPPGYELLVESTDLDHGRAAETLLRGIDDAMQRLNCEYREKRISGRLKPLSLRPLPSGTWSALTRRAESRVGGSLEQYKHPCLLPEVNAGERLSAA